MQINKLLIYFRCGSNWTTSLTINAAAQATFASTVYSNSDRHIKKHIQNIDKQSLHDLFNISDKLLKKFILKQTGKQTYGFIAQELEKYIPEAVSNNINKDDKIKTVSYDIAYAKILAAIIQKIKEIDK